MAFPHRSEYFWTGKLRAAGLLTLAGLLALSQAAHSDSPAAASLVLPVDAPARATLLMTAIQHGNVSKVKAILHRDPAAANTLGVAGHEPLITALEQKDKALISLLLAAGADVNKPDRRGILPLFTAINSGQVGLVQMLVNHGASLTVADTNGYSPLGATLVGDAHGSSAVVSYLLSKGAEVPATLPDGRSPIEVAIDTNNVTETALPILLDHVKDVNALDGDGLSLLHRAVERLNYEFARLLLGRGAAVDVHSATGETPLHSAVAIGDIQMSEILLDNKADPNARSSRGETSLALALRGSYFPDEVAYANRQDRNDFVRRLGSDKNAQGLVSLLVGRGARADIADQFGLTPLHYALLNHNAEALAMLPPTKPTPFLSLLLAAAANQTAPVAARLKANPDLVYTRLPTGTTALGIAALWDATESAAALLQAGADINTRDAYAQTPLALACRTKGDSAMVKFLVAHGADISAGDYRDATPLHLAVMADDLDSVNALIAAKADVNARSRAIGIPLSYVRSGDAIARALLAAGADPDISGQNQPSLLMAALGNRNTALIKLLIARGVCLNRHRPNEYPPLMQALINRDTDDAKVLIAAGADVSVTQSGDTPLSLAQSIGASEVVSLLKARLAGKAAAQTSVP